MKDESIHIDYLIARYLAEEASPEEMAELWYWMDMSETNKKYFSDIRFIHDKAVASHQIVKVNVDHAWNKVNQKMVSIEDTKQQKSTFPDISRMFTMTSWLRIAALLVLVSGLSIMIFLLLNNNTQPTTVACLKVSKEYKLADSTQFILNKKSQLSYDHQYNKKNRTVHLSGEAYFKVKHIPEKKFIVETEGVLIEDIGTTFNIKAYALDSVVEVTVESGVVKFFTSGTQGIMIYQGETGIYRKDSHVFRKKLNKDINILSFHTQVFLFENALLSDVLRKIESQYDQKIVVVNPKLLDCRITVTFDHEEPGNMMGIIAETLGLSLVHDKKGFRLDGESCNAH